MAKKKGEKKGRVEELIAKLKDKDEYVRKASALALGTIRDKSAVPALIETLKDKNEDWKVRDAAAGVLGCEIGDKRAIPALIEALKDESKEVRRSALMPLDILLEDMTIIVKDKRVVPALIEALKDEDGEVRESAVSVLGKLGDERAIPALVDHLKAVSDKILNADIAQEYYILNCIWALSDLINKLKKKYEQKTKMKKG
jgi:HEAT repeat protein